MPYSLFLDSVILVLLVATIIYSARLSLYLKRFRDSKSDLESIVTDLSRQIEKADKAIRGMHEAAEDGGNDLQKRMDRANAMFDELQMIVEAGDALATRLEKLAVRNDSSLEDAATKSKPKQKRSAKSDDYDERVKTIMRGVDQKEEDGGADMPSSFFSIRDPDIERGEEAGGGFSLSDEDSELLSDAERDLYEAIQSKKSRAGGKK